jgi:hypothetical protein
MIMGSISHLMSWEEANALVSEESSHFFIQVPSSGLTLYYHRNNQPSNNSLSQALGSRNDSEIYFLLPQGLSSPASPGKPSWVEQGYPVQCCCDKR